jgi:hypothetical protein
MAKLELALLCGEESKNFLAQLTKQIDRLEECCGKICDVKPPQTDMEDRKAEEDEEDFSAKPVKASKKAKADFDDDEDAEEEEGEADAEVLEDEPVKKAKPKKLTSDDCNDAAKTLAKSIGGKEGREKVLGLMKKHFKTESVSELKPEQYEKFCKVMKESM